MLYHSANYSNKNNITRPSDWVPPSFKLTPEFNQQWADYIYSQWINGGSIVNYDEQAQIQVLRDYAAGRQDPNIYKDLYYGKAKDFQARDPEKWEVIFKDREGFRNIDFEHIFSPIPAVLKNI